ncbi:hypothetical protein V8G54_017920 [Vigna mungo]|uniref:Uncharacterized protein n=1 Tax=Vigna mungo TaxID=3915 RepID=A0AAQ3N7M0_VIGMU
MQWVWKPCLQLGSARTLSPSANSDRHTAHSCKEPPCTAAEKEKVGRERDKRAPRRRRQKRTQRLKRTMRIMRRMARMAVPTITLLLYAYAYSDSMSGSIVSDMSETVSVKGRVFILYLDHIDIFHCLQPLLVC